MKPVEIIIGILVGSVVLLLLWLLLVMTPVMLYTQAECLRDGYPKYAVSIGLERYCTTLDGAVTVAVKKAGTPR